MSKTKSVVEIVYLNGNGSKSYNSIYKNSGHSKMIIIQDDDDEQFPSPRLCLLRKWPNFDAGFGFTLFEDLLNATGALKVEKVTKNSPAEVGGLRVNDVLIEINGEYVEYKSFFHLIEILKDAFSKHEIELLVLSEEEANWYKERDIVVNSKFPNIQYCETPYYAHKFRDIESNDINSKIIGFDDKRLSNPSLANTSSDNESTFKSTYVINTNEDKIYKYTKPLKKSQSFRSSLEINNDASLDKKIGENDKTMDASDSLLDKWSEVMDKYLDAKYKSNSSLHDSVHSNDNNDQNESNKSHVIKLSNDNKNEKERSRSLNSPRNNNNNNNQNNQKPFSFLFSGRDDYDQEIRGGSKYNSNIDKSDKISFRPISKQFTKEKPVQPLKVINPDHVKPNIIYNHENEDLELNNAKIENVKPTSASPYIEKENKQTSVIEVETTKPKSESIQTRDAFLRPLLNQEFKQPQLVTATVNEPKSESIQTRDAFLRPLLNQEFKQPQLVTATVNEPKSESIQTRDAFLRPLLNQEFKQPQLVTATVNEPKSESIQTRDAFLRPLLNQEFKQPQLVTATVNEPKSESIQTRDAFLRPLLNQEFKQPQLVTATVNEPKSESIQTRDAFLRPLLNQEFKQPQLVATVNEPKSESIQTRDAFLRPLLNQEFKQPQLVATVNEPKIVVSKQDEEHSNKLENDKIYKKLENELDNYMKIPNDDNYEIHSDFEALPPPPLPVSPPPLPVSLPPAAPPENKAESSTFSSNPEISIAVLSKLLIHANQEATNDQVQLQQQQKAETVEIETIAEPIVEEKIIVTGNQNKFDDNFDNFFKNTENESDEINKHLDLLEKSYTSEENRVLIDKDSLNDMLKAYHVAKDPEYFGFGIILHTEKDEDDDESEDGGIQIYYPILEIEENSPALKAGLKTDQRLIAVNKKYINTDLKTIEDLAQCIDECYYQKGFTEFLVIDSEIWDLIKDDNDLLDSLCTPKQRESDVIETTGDDKQEQDVINEPKLTNEEPFNEINESSSVNEQASVNESTDMSPLISTVTDDKSDKTLPRFCHLVRSSNDDQYGFDFKTLKNEGKHVAINVREGLPAQKAGLRNGDFIIEINSTPIEFVEHEKVVNLVFEREKDVDLLVVEDLKGYKTILNQQEKLIKDLNLSQKIVANADDTTNPDDISYHRVILMDTYKGIGLHLTANGLISYIEPSSPAHISGLKKGAKVVLINNTDVSEAQTRDIAKLIKDNINDLEIGIKRGDRSSANNSLERPQSSREAQQSENEIVNENVEPTGKSPMLYENENENEKQQSPILAASSSIKRGDELGEVTEHTRVCNLVTRSDFTSFGFGLKKKKDTPYQVANIAPNSPADVAGLLDGDMLLKINDAWIVGEKYAKTILRIKNELDNGRIKLEVIQPQYFNEEYKVNREVGGEPGEDEVDEPNPITTSSVKSRDRKSQDNRLSTISLPEYVNDEQLVTAEQTNDSPLSKKAVSLANIESEISIREINKSRQPEKASTSQSTRSLSSLKNAPKFKRCTIITSQNYVGFGFKINKELKPKYMICAVEPNSPASRANIGEKDVLVEVNNKNIRRSKFSKVRRLLSDAVAVGKVELLLINMEGYLWYKAKNKRFSTKLTTPDNVEKFSSVDNPEQVVLNTNEGEVQSNQENEETLPITVRKEENYDGYGMALSVVTSKASKYSFPIVTSVETNSPAEHSGLSINDMIIEINGNETNHQSDTKIANYIKNSGSILQLLIRRKKRQENVILNKEASTLNEVRQLYDEVDRKIDDDADSTNNNNNADGNNSDDDAENQIANRGLLEDDDENDEEERQEETQQANQESQNMSSENEYENTETMPQITNTRVEMSSSKIHMPSEPASNSPSMDAPVPRLCRVRAYESNLGFVVLGSRKNLGVFKVAEIVPNSSAFHSGLRNNDRIIEINGTNVQSMTYNELITLIRSKKEEDNLQMLVADEDTFEWYSARNTRISSSMVPRLTYIETILQEEMENNMIDSMNTTNRTSRSSTEINNEEEEEEH